MNNITLVFYKMLLPALNQNLILKLAGSFLLSHKFVNTFFTLPNLDLHYYFSIAKEFSDINVRFNVLKINKIQFNNMEISNS